VSSHRAIAEIGRELGGRYRLVAPIGVGTSSRVFLAVDTQLRRRVAVKLLHAALAADDTFLRRFRAEARAAGALNHPNIVAVYDWGEDETDEGMQPYLVTEYLGGGSLRRILDRGRPLSPSQALMVGLLDPTYKETLVGNAQIREVFKVTKSGNVAGCMVTDGKVTRGNKVRLLRDNVVIHEGTLKSLRRFKDEVKEVQHGFECGMAFENYEDMKVGDIVECFDVEQVQATL